MNRDEDEFELELFDLKNSFNSDTENQKTLKDKDDVFGNRREKLFRNLNADLTRKRYRRTKSDGDVSNPSSPLPFSSPMFDHLDPEVECGLPDTSEIPVETDKKSWFKTSCTKVQLFCGTSWRKLTKRKEGKKVSVQDVDILPGKKIATFLYDNIFVSPSCLTLPYIFI